MKAEDPKQPRQPWRFTVDGGEPFAFAGLCTRKEWEDPEDRGFDDGWLYSCTIVTTTPNELVAKVHDRMPAILPGPEAEAAWLRPDLELEDAVAMCAPLPAYAHGQRPRQPEAEQGRQRQRGRPRAARRPCSRLSVSRLFFLFFGPFPVFFFGFFVDRRRRFFSIAGAHRRRAGAGGQRAGDLGAGTAVVRQIEAKGSTQVLLRLAAGQASIPDLLGRSRTAPIRP